jgi:heme/copper-type cytochrome/quinol oxidase subunit 1
MAGLVILAVSPLTAAQLMLMVDRYLGGHFFDTQAGGSAVMWMHFFWVFGHPEVYVLVIPPLHSLRKSFRSFPARRFSATRSWWRRRCASDLSA